MLLVGYDTDTSQLSTRLARVHNIIERENVKRQIVTHQLMPNIFRTGPGVEHNMSVACWCPGHYQFGLVSGLGLRNSYTDLC